jgi:hypothetical protein
MKIRRETFDTSPTIISVALNSVVFVNNKAEKGAGNAIIRR